MRGLLLVSIVCYLLAPAAESLRIGAFNIQTFGRTKASKPEVMGILANIVRRYDILLIQEIRDISGEALVDLLNLANQDQPDEMKFSMLLSARLGRSTYKEQYAYFYRPGQGLTVTGSYVYDDGDETMNTDTEIFDLFEREPYVVAFKSTSTVMQSFTLVGVHVDPDDAPDEINALYDVIFDAIAKLGNSDVMVLGDLNADCSYVTSSEWPGIILRTDPAFRWWIGDEADTTVKSTDCAYDRFVSYGADWPGGIVADSAVVYRFDTDPDLGTMDSELAEDVSDHYPIEFQLKQQTFAVYTVSSVYVILENPDVSLSQETYYNLNSSFQVTDNNNNLVATLRTETKSERARRDALSGIFDDMMTSSNDVRMSLLPVSNRYKGKQKCNLYIEVEANESSTGILEKNLDENRVKYSLDYQ